MQKAASQALFFSFAVYLFKHLVSQEERVCLRQGQDRGRGLYLFSASPTQRWQVTTRLLFLCPGRRALFFTSCGARKGTRSSA